MWFTERPSRMPVALENLPAELVLRILAYLPVQSLRALRLTSRSWHTFFTDNESTIYHHAALLHRFIDSINTLLPKAKELHPLTFLQDVPNWYEYCECRCPARAIRADQTISRPKVLSAAAKLARERVGQGPLLWRPPIRHPPN